MCACVGHKVCPPETTHTRTLTTHTTPVFHPVHAQVLHANDCSIEVLGDEVGQLVSLTQLSLCNNRLTTLPTAIAGWHVIDKMFLNNNESE